MANQFQNSIPKSILFQKKKEKRKRKAKSKSKKEKKGKGNPIDLWDGGEGDAGPRGQLADF